MNKLASYKDPERLRLVKRWFHDAHGESTTSSGGTYTVYDLYQAFSEYTISRQYIAYRLNLQEFVKCLVACKIIDIGGQFRCMPEYEPSVSAVTRATA